MLHRKRGRLGPAHPTCTSSTATSAVGAVAAAGPDRQHALTVGARPASSSDRSSTQAARSGDADSAGPEPDFLTVIHVIRPSQPVMEPAASPAGDVLAAGSRPDSPGPLDLDRSSSAPSSRPGSSGVFGKRALGRAAAAASGMDSITTLNADEMMEMLLLVSFRCCWMHTHILSPWCSYLSSEPHHHALLPGARTHSNDTAELSCSLDLQLISGVVCRCAAAVEGAAPLLQATASSAAEDACRLAPDSTEGGLNHAHVNIVDTRTHTHTHANRARAQSSSQHTCTPTPCLIFYVPTLCCCSLCDSLACTCRAASPTKALPGCCGKGCSRTSSVLLSHPAQQSCCTTSMCTLQAAAPTHRI